VAPDAQVGTDAVGGGQGRLVVAAEHLALGPQGVLVEHPGLAGTAHRTQRVGQVERRQQGLLGGIAQRVAPAGHRGGGQVAAGVVVAAGEVVPHAIDHQLPDLLGAGAQHVAVDQVWRQFRVPGPAGRVVGVAGVGGGQHAAHRAQQHGVPLRGEALAEHAAHQRVHEQMVTGRVEVGQPVPADQPQRRLEPALDAHGRAQLGRERQHPGTPQQAPGHRCAAEKGTEFEELVRGRRVGAQGVGGQAPGDPDRGRECQLAGPPGVRLEVVADRAAGGRPDRGRQVERHRHVLEPLGQPVGVGRGQLGAAGAEQVDAVRPVEHADRHGLRHLDRPARVAAGDQHVPGAARQVRLDLLGPVGVLEDDQPVAVRLAPAQRVAYRGQRTVDVARFGQGQMLGQPDQRRPGAGRLLGRDPPHQVVRFGVPVYIFHGQLGTSGATERVLLAGEQHDGAGRQPGAQPGEEVLAAHEAGVPRRQATQDRHADYRTWNHRDCGRRTRCPMRS
jgi:hypothetical protein